MKNTFKTMLISGGLLAAAAVPTSAEVETEIHVGYNSIYEFRGVNFGDNMIESGIESSMELGGGFNLTVGAWYADVRSAPAANELDLYVAVSKEFGPIEASIGYTYYMFPDSSATETHEVFVGLSTELFHGIGLAVTFYSDFDEIDGDYLEAELSKEFEINECTTLELAGGAAYSFDYNPHVNGGALDGFNHWYISASVTWSVTDSVNISPYLKYVNTDSDLASETSDGNSEDYLIGGVSVGYSF